MDAAITPLQSVSKQGKLRLSWMVHYKKFNNARLTCRHFGISPSTFYHWKRKFERSASVEGLEDLASRRPHHLRQPKWNQATLLLINRFLEQHPQSSNKAIQTFLIKHNVQVSASTLSRIMRKLLTHKQKFAW
jgi:transposase-like protein